MSQTTEKASRFTRFGAWVAELVLVLVSVNAAFWLNNYQQHRQDAQRRNQILASLEPDSSRESRAEKLTARKKNDKRPNSDGRAPPVKCRRCTPLFFTTYYSPGDIATLLQSGGVELLEVKTLMALRELESVIRWGLSDMQRYQKLSDELIVPNLDQDISSFYDPATKKLRKRFEIYPQALEATVKFAHDSGANQNRVGQTNSSRAPGKSLI